MLHRTSVRLVGLLLLLASWLTASQAMANSGPPAGNGDKAGLILPGTSTQVHVKREELRFDLSESYREARVTARYEMENRGAAQSPLPVIFVMQDTGAGDPAFAATWNGQPLQVARVETSGLPAQQQQEMDRAWGALTALVDPVTGERYSMTDYHGGAIVVRYFRFELNLPAAAAGVLEVTFNQTAAWEKNRHVNMVYHYQYLLSPAKGWASFGPLEIRVKAPGERPYLASTIPLTQEGGEFRASLPGLPQENLAFSVMSTRGVWLGATEPGFYYLLSFIILLVLGWLLGLGMGRLAGRLRSRGWAIFTGAAAGLMLGGAANLLLALAVTNAIPALGSQAYGNLFAAVGEGFLATLLTAGVATVSAARVNRRRHGAAS